jgi:ethanolamine ammonia-lyase large subunit
MYKKTIANRTYSFPDLKTLLAKASPFRSGDALAGICAATYEERVAAQFCLADVPLKNFLSETFIPYEDDEITRLIIDTHDKDSFSDFSSLTVGMLRDWMLSENADELSVRKLQTALIPEMVAAVSKIMRNQDLILAVQKIRNVTRFRNTLGLKGRFSSRIQPNHPADDLKGILASIIDGLLNGSGDAVIGVNPVSDDIHNSRAIVHMINELIRGFDIPTQSCVLCHVSTTIKLIEQNAPVDLVFQSIGGTEKTNTHFGVNLSMLNEAHDAGSSLNRGSIGRQFMYFETGQGSSLSADAHFGLDQQTLEARAYAVARKFDPLLVNSVVGFIGPEYLYDGKQITRAALEDHFCGKIMGLPMGVDICYTNHAEADQDDMDNLLILLGVAGCNYIMGVPGSDDVMLHYQSTSYHDVSFTRKAIGLRPAPEFEQWLMMQGITDEKGNLLQPHDNSPLLTYKGS